jgi:hypothetical protein
MKDVTPAASYLLEPTQGNFNGARWLVVKGGALEVSNK